MLRANNKLVLVSVQHEGTIDKPTLQAKLKSEKSLSKRDSEAVRDIIFWIFNLDFDLKPFYRAAKNDATMDRVVSRLYGLKSPATPTVFEALIDSLIEQQISLKVANSLERRMIKKFGDKLRIEDRLYYAYPTQEKLSNIDISQLRECGLSLRKAEYVKNVSKLIVDGKLDLEKLKDWQDLDKIVAELDSIRGIGIWTAEMAMVRGMRKLDTMPADDLGLKRTISHYYAGSRKITGEEARRIATKWDNWKGLAAYYLIVAERLGIE